MSRIIAGSRRGHRLSMPPGAGTRPTTDRTREALFSALTAWAGSADAPAEEALAGLAFADLYAGSGAVGLEAASRGADPVLLVEADRRTAAVAARNARDIGLAVTVVAQRVDRWLPGGADRSFDIVFADPPYELASADLDGLVRELLERGRLAENGLVVLERSRRSAPPNWPAALTERWHRQYGESVLHFAAP